MFLAFLNRAVLALALVLGAAVAMAAESPADAASRAAPPSAARPPIALAPVDDAWRAALPRDARAAAQAYLDRLSPEAVQRANDYFEGGYWLQGVELLLGLAIAAAMLHGRRAARVRDWAGSVARPPLLRDALFGAVYAVAAWSLALPLTVYRDFVREHAYGMATQSFAAWAGEQLLVLAVTTALTALAVAILYAAIRRSGDRWWLWASAISVGLLAGLVMIGPVFIDPLFNDYRPVEEGPVKESVLVFARANAVPVDKVLEFDASRQTTRVSANVSGMFGTAAVRVNDNLLRRASLPEIRAVVAHEMGHYVLNHVYKLMLQFGLLILFGFAFCDWAMRRLFQRYGSAWGTHSVADVASLPLLAAAFSVFMALATPVFNTMIRTQEIEADRFALNLAREPHGFAEGMLKLAEYRKPDPGPVEEFVFFTHPSARHRLEDAMRWREAMGTP